MKVPGKPGVRCFGSMKALDGLVLATLRVKKLNLSQPAFAHKVGVSPATVSRAEQERKISRTSAIAIAGALGEAVENLFADDVSVAVPEEDILENELIHAGDVLKGTRGPMSTASTSPSSMQPQPGFGTRTEIEAFLLRQRLALDHIDDYIELESDERGWVRDEVEFRYVGLYEPPPYLSKLMEKYRAKPPLREYFSFCDVESRTRDEEHKLIIFVQGGDWRYVYAINELYKNLPTDPRCRKYREKCEEEFMPGEPSRLYRQLACHVIVVSSDNRIVLTRRRQHTRSGFQVPFYPGAWAASLEENVLRGDPSGETASDPDLFACVERGIKEELKIEIRPDDTRLLSYGIEWDNFAAAFVFMAKTDAPYETVAKNWASAKDRVEAIAIDNVQADVATVRGTLVKTGWSPSIQAKTWKSRTAIAEDHWHGTSRARLLSYLHYLQRDESW
jgi:transcriptional regulator with XRE-family HTH domain